MMNDDGILTWNVLTWNVLRSATNLLEARALTTWWKMSRDRCCTSGCGAFNAPINSGTKSGQFPGQSNLFCIFIGFIYSHLVSLIIMMIKLNKLCKNIIKGSLILYFRRIVYFTITISTHII